MFFVRKKNIYSLNLISTPFRIYERNSINHEVLAITNPPNQRALESIRLLVILV